MVLGPDLVDATTKKIEIIKQKLLTAQSQQKSYANQRRRLLEFSEGDHVFLRVTPTTSIGRSIKAKKLSRRFLGPFEILDRIGAVAYQYQLDLSHILELEELELHDNLTYQVEPERILDVKDQQLRNKTIWLVKVFWKGMSPSDAT
ncbi:uncharacterized protein LOC114754843 [Neltuma alba]|uniref:uncharacterized protein LOC114754843 n=1 Tax=Neltuma alba TaxID=207710 RepID=UPI0010A4F60F|nr:uncharacterized protein LOC114754843 [Prosopis alba]